MPISLMCPGCVERADCKPLPACPPASASTSELTRIGTEYLLRPNGSERHNLGMITCLGLNLGRAADVEYPVALLTPKTGTRNLSLILPTERFDDPTRCVHQIHERPKSWDFADLTKAGIDPSAQTCGATTAALRFGLRAILGQLFAAPRYRFVTLVREPFERLISEWSHREGDLLDWGLLAKFINASQQRNFQLAFLVGKRLGLRVRLEGGTKRDFAIDELWCRSPGYGATRADLRRLQQLSREGRLLLGLTDRFEESVAMFAARLGWESVCSEGRAGGGGGREGGASPSPSRPLLHAPASGGRATSAGGCAFELRGQQAKRAFSKGHSRRITMSRLSSAEVPAELRALFTRLNGLDYELYQFARAESESWRG